MKALETAKRYLAKLGRGTASSLTKDHAPIPIKDQLDAFKIAARKGLNEGEFTLHFRADQQQSDIPDYQINLSDKPSNNVIYLGLDRLQVQGKSTARHVVTGLRLRVDAQRDLVGFDETNRLSPLQLDLSDNRGPEFTNIRSSTFVLNYRLTEPTSHTAVLATIHRSILVAEADGGSTSSSVELDHDGIAEVIRQHGDWILQPVDLMTTTEMYLTGRSPTGDLVTAAHLHEHPVIFAV